MVEPATDAPAPTGLTAAAAAAARRAHGPNTLPRDKPRAWWRQLFEVVREPMVALLVLAAALYMAMGDPREAVVLSISVAFVIALTIFNERKTERAVAALRGLTSPKAIVIRDGKRQAISGGEVVVGDVVVLVEGDRVPADAEVIVAPHLRVDESLLTGESVAVQKAVASTAASAAPGVGDGAGVAGTSAPKDHALSPSHVYAGSSVVGGGGMVRVVAIGVHSELGKLGASLAGIKDSRTPLQAEVRRLVWWFASAGLALCALLIGWLRWREASWVASLLAGVAFSISILPEEYPVILTLFLSLGAWRMSRRNVLVRRMPAVETMGAVTVLCVDKTGTLTQNRMSLAAQWTAATGASRNEALVRLGALASQPDGIDPMDAALLAAHGPNPNAGTLQRAYPLSAELAAYTNVRQPADATRSWCVASKGAPAAMLTLCRLGAAEAAPIRAAMTELTAQGLRVLGVATATWPQSADQTLPDNPAEFPFAFVGLVAFADPLREGVPQAVGECLSAGLRVMMITGDAMGTATTIAKQAGFPKVEALEGREIDDLDDDQLRDRLRTVTVIARAVPAHKLRIVQALIAAGEVVAMTGDGVNDAPALKAAHVGVAMGKRGTEVARQAAAIVLADDDFSSIVAGVRTGRRIFDNLCKAFGFVLAVHVAIALLALVPLFLGYPAIFFPVHLVFLELIIDPACSVAYEAEPEGADIMKRPPRARTVKLLDRRRVIMGTVQGLAMFACAMAILLWGNAAHRTPDQIRELTFVAVVIGLLVLIVVDRSTTKSLWAMLGTRNTPLWLVVGGAIVLLAVAVSWGPMRKIFHFAGAPFAELGAVAGLTLLAVGSVSLLARFVVRRAVPRS